MTNRQANIYNAIKEAFEEVDVMEEELSKDEILQIYKNLQIIAEYDELKKIKEIAMLYALSRLC